jgi:hypothetical protein
MSSATFWLLPSTPRYCWSAVQVVVARSEIWTVRRVVKQLPVEMLQPCLRGSSCMRMRSVMEEHYKGCQHSTPLVLNSHKSTTTNVNIPRLLFWMVLCNSFSVSQYTSDVIVVPCCMSSTINAPFLSQNIVAISILAGRHLFKFFRLVSWICVHLLLWLLFGFNI